MREFRVYCTTVSLVLNELKILMISMYLKNYICCRTQCRLVAARIIRRISVASEQKQLVLQKISEAIIACWFTRLRKTLHFEECKCLSYFYVKSQWNAFVYKVKLSQRVSDVEIYQDATVNRLFHLHIRQEHVDECCRRAIQRKTDAWVEDVLKNNQ